MELPRALRKFNRQFSNRLMLHLAWWLPPFVVLTHRGRKTGRSYRTPLVAFRKGSSLRVALGYGRDVDWVLNLLALGTGTMTRMGRDYRIVNPRLVEPGYFLFETN